MQVDINEQYLAKVSESLHNVVQLSSRIDERVQNLGEKLKEQDSKFGSLMETNTALISRIAVLESKNGEAQAYQIEELKTKLHAMEIIVARLELSSASMEGKWSKIFDFIFKIIFVITGCYIVYKLGIPVPQVM